MCVRTTHQPINHTPKIQPPNPKPQTYKDILLIKFLMMLKRVRIWLLRPCQRCFFKALNASKVVWCQLCHHDNSVVVTFHHPTNWVHSDKKAFNSHSSLWYIVVKGGSYHKLKFGHSIVFNWQWWTRGKTKGVIALAVFGFCRQSTNQ